MYFSAVKIKWVMENCPDAIKAMEEGGRERRVRTEEQRGTSTQNNTYAVLMKAGACSSGSCTYYTGYMYSDIVRISTTTRT